MTSSIPPASHRSLPFLFAPPRGVCTTTRPRPVDASPDRREPGHGLGRDAQNLVHESGGCLVSPESSILAGTALQRRVRRPDHHGGQPLGHALLRRLPPFGGRLGQDDQALAAGPALRDFGLTEFEPNRWYQIRMEARPAEQVFDVFIDGRKVSTARNPTAPSPGQQSAVKNERIPGLDAIWLGEADDLSYRGGAYNRGEAEWRNFLFYHTPPEGERISPAGRVKAPAPRIRPTLP